MTTEESAVAVIETKNNAVAPVESSPMAMMQMAINSDMDLDRLERMLALQEKYEQMEAKKAFTAAMSAFKEDPPVITKDKDNKQYRSRYTSLGNLINASLPKMSRQGLAHKWEITQGDKMVTVTCIVTHKLGHSELTSMTAPPDGSGSKNPIQMIKSTITYLKAATFESIMGLASTDANLDDDGNGFQQVQTITEKQISQLTDMVNHVGADEAAFCQWMKVESLDKIQANQFNRAIAALKAKEKKS